MCRVLVTQKLEIDVRRHGDLRMSVEQD
jgi:hypothetical protein